ncbi:hypothetical protein [Pseudomonas sp. 21]|uniref:hypothetical protein n=1 Tax=Pseudomonas sp. 21 TaxID=1619948 RepID=UPI000AD98DB1|nr:hypothetical protein [Pseudomonas sp. 21]
MNIVILDDDTPRAESWVDSMRTSIGGDGHSVTALSVPEVSEVISSLHKSRYSAREGEYKTVAQLDEVDLLIVDYDLLGLDTEGTSAWSTGAEVAYAARLMSLVGPIVVVNQYGTNSFDLTMRRTSPSYADLDLGSKHVTSAELWRSSDFTEFRPWHWPNLLVEPVRFKDLSNFIEANIDKSIIETLQLNIEDFDSPRYIPHELLARLGLLPDKSITFRSLLTGRRGEGKLQPNPISVFNILEKDAKIIEKLPNRNLANLAAAVLSHWIERLILPNQELICDAPHLVSRYPWVLENYKDESAWRKICDLHEVHGLVPDLEKFRVYPECLVSRPAYWGQEVKGSIKRPVDFSIRDIPNLAFCEDASRFVDKSSCKSYPSDLQSFDRERWVVDELSAGGEKVNYEPQAYLLM